MTRVNGVHAAAPAGPKRPSEADKIMELCTGLWKQQALRAAVKLGIIDAPDFNCKVDAAVPASKLAADMDCHADHLYRLLRFLSQFGLFDELPGQSFKLTSMGQYLRSDHPSGLCHLAVTVGDPGHYLPWMHLEKAVKEGKGAFELFAPKLHGGLFEYLSLPENMDEQRTFTNLMTTLTKTMDTAATLHDFSSYQVVADVGGGHGRLLMDIMDAYPGVHKGIVLDVPSVVDAVPQLLDRFQGKLQWVKGDFFEKIPVKADCYFMKSILHDWSDERCLKILTNLRTAMPPGSTLVNFDRLLPNYGTPGVHTAKTMDMNMLVMLNSKERTTQQWYDLMGKAGFTIKSIVDRQDMGAIVAVVGGSEGAC